MPYNAYTYEHVSTGVCSIQDALDVLNNEDTQQFLDNLENDLYSWQRYGTSNV